VTATSIEAPPCTRVAQRLAESIGARRYSMWFDQTARFNYCDLERRLEIAVPNRFVADWIGRNFETDLRRIAALELGEGIDLQVEIKPDLFGDLRAASLQAEPASAQTATPSALAPRPSRTGAAAAIEAAPLFRHRLEDFIVGPSNELAFTAAQRLLEDEQAATNPLFLHGGCGLGKTHPSPGHLPPTDRTSSRPQERPHPLHDRRAIH